MANVLNSQELMQETVFEQTARDKASSMIKELNERDVFRSGDFDKDLPDMINELSDRDVDVSDFLGASRRIVFKARYQGRDVVVKFSHAFHSINRDERQQQQEESIWNSAKDASDRKFFAEIFLTSASSRFVVQELCTDVDTYENDDLIGTGYMDMTEKYSIGEISLGYTRDNLLVFVDYGY